MLIKSADHKESQIAILQQLISNKCVPAEKRQLIERELKNLSIGFATEKKAAFEIDFYAAKSRNLFVLHDLRLEIGGRVAQIDHLLMNRALEVFVLETKTFGTGISINDRGEFSTFYEGKEIGIPSPVEQNARHISLLKEAFKEIGLPKRLGISLQPSFKSVVLVSPKAVINRPNVINFDASIIKLDQFFSWYKNTANEGVLKDIIALLKVCSEETVRNLGEKLLALHTPSHVDYIKKFELDSTLLSRPPVASIRPEQEIYTDQNLKDKKATQHFFCARCKKSIPQVVANYCWNHKSKFHGKAYCRDCQKNILIA